MRLYRGPARDLRRIESARRSPLLAHFAECASGAAGRAVLRAGLAGQPAEREGGGNHKGGGAR